VRLQLWAQKEKRQPRKKSNRGRAWICGNERLASQKSAPGERRKYKERNYFKRLLHFGREEGKPHYSHVQNKGLVCARSLLDTFQNAMSLHIEGGCSVKRGLCTQDDIQVSEPEPKRSRKFSSEFPEGEKAGKGEDAGQGGGNVK